MLGLINLQNSKNMVKSKFNDCVNHLQSCMLLSLHTSQDFNNFVRVLQKRRQTTCQLQSFCRRQH